MYPNLDEFLFIPISDFILSSVGERPRYMDENFNPPVGEYCAVKIEMISPLSWCNSAYEIDQDGAVNNTTFEATVRIVAVGKNSMTKAQVIATCLRDKNLLRTTLRPHGIAYFNSTPVRDTSISWLDKRERRYELLAQFRFIQGGAEKGEAPYSIENFGGASGSYTI